MIFTSYFGNLRNLPDTLYKISIARWAPKWYTGDQLTALAPTVSILEQYRNTLDEEAYAREYINTVLKVMDAQQVVGRLEQKARGKDVVLLCYETPENFCHRHLVAAWLTEHGVPCEEWGVTHE